MEIFYYSGTGFTLTTMKTFTALVKEDVRIRPIVQLMKQGERSSAAETVGLFLPMHAFGLPRAFREFLKRFSFPRASYIFALVTRGGAPTKIHREIDRLLRRKGCRLAAFQYVTNPNTFDIIFPLKMEQAVIDARNRAEEDLQAFAAQVCRREAGINRGYRNRFHENVTFPLMKWMSRATGYFNLQKDFYADGNCTGCGQCEQVCLSGKIHLEDGHPRWNKAVSCQYCLACLHLCPVQAIQVRNSKTAERKRIHHPDVDWRAIAAQK
ncbi:MAG: EFR1 family ferrodoxin [Spirochaetales bacterium]|nr:EFR1 family ferrodoxin [Spirochaetales bacterium]